MRVCLVIPAAGGHAEAVIAAVRGNDPGASFEAVWAGDPQLRPAPPSACDWIDLALPEPTGVGWQRLAVARDPDAYELALGLTAASTALVGSTEGLVLVRVGRAAVLASLVEYLPDAGLVVGQRRAGTLATDGHAPTPADLVQRGCLITSVIGLAPDAAQLARALAGAAASCAPGVSVDAVFSATVDAIAGSTQVHRVDDAAVGWSDAERLPAAVDISDVDRHDPWCVTFGSVPPRWKLSDHPRLAPALDAAQPQWVGVTRALCAPGGLEIDATIRGLMGDAIEAWLRDEAQLPPEPWSDAQRFREWLETPERAWGADVGRYWSALHADRPDLRLAFPDPVGTHHAEFADWTRRRWSIERASSLLRTSASPLRPPWKSVSALAGGVNVIGYLGFDSSLGDVGRRVVSCLAAADVPVAALEYYRSGSPRSAAKIELTDTLRYDTNLIVLNADQLPYLHGDYGTVLFPGRRNVGYWFWDVAYIPPSVVDALGWLDEVWVASEFTAAALRAVTDKPIRVVPVPVPQPGEVVAPSAVGGPFQFLTTFDYLSVAERKNPLGTIEAFKRAYPEPAGDGPRLLVKSINAAHRPHESERVLLAAAGRTDIAVVDAHVTRAEQLGIIAAADCLVALHRSEGLGLHLLEAMWLGTPVITTRYSGNLDYLDDECAVLIDARLIGVTRGESYFPPEAVWADPDLDQAAAWMRRLADEPPLCERLVAAGRARMQQQPNLAAAGQRMRDLLTDTNFDRPNHEGR